MKQGTNYFVCNRSLFKNPMWYAEKFTKGQAWIDLFGNANHSPGYFEKHGQRVELERGQTGRSIETLAKDWKWSRNKVKRFLKRLVDDSMIDHKTNHLTSVITICNYDKFQFNEKTNEPPNELPSEPPNEPSGEPQTKKKRIISNKEIKPKSIPQKKIAEQINGEVYLTKKKRKLTGKRLETFLQFWSAFNYQKDKAAAADSWFDIPELRPSLVETICTAAKVEAENRGSLVDKGSTPIYAQGWLTARRWEDEATGSTTDTGSSKAQESIQKTQDYINS